jgi:hypothetical protein
MNGIRWNIDGISMEYAGQIMEYVEYLTISTQYAGD